MFEQKLPTRFLPSVGTAYPSKCQPFAAGNADDSGYRLIPISMGFRWVFQLCILSFEVGNGPGAWSLLDEPLILKGKAMALKEDLNKTGKCYERSLDIKKKRR